MSSSSTIESELYYLVTKFLECGPCQGSAQLLKQEIEDNGLLPQRFDWMGVQHVTTFTDIDRNNSHILPNHLFRIVDRINKLLEVVSPPAVTGIQSLLGNGRQSLLRDFINKVDPNLRYNSSSHLTAFRNGAQLLPSAQQLVSHPFNATLSLIARQNSGPLTHKQLLPSKCYDKFIRCKRLLGHLSSVYCVSFDRTGRYIITGADDSLVKIWSAADGRLLATLRGHINEITDLTINYENTLIAAGSCDKMIRVWCLKTTAPITVLNGHNAQITSVKFCPLARDDNRYLVSTANDGCVCFWRYNASTNEFHTQPKKFIERHKPGSQLVCSSFSSGGVFLAVGSTDNYLRVYHVTAPAGPTKILEIEQHSDHVDSLQFSNLSTRFVSGSKDGVAHIWYFERQHWHNIPLKMNERLPGTAPPTDEITRKVKVSMVGWTCDDVHVITSLSDHSLKVWTSQTGQLRHVLYGHEDEVFVIEAHPKDSRIFLSGGHDGAIILWDIISGNAIKTFYNSIDGQGHGAVFDCKFSPDGLMFASTDSHGHLSFFGMASAEPYKKIPDQVFFHTDYRPVIRDANHYAIDEQTQCAPHLMPPPFLVDIDGNPYPPNYQRLVPGRESCSDSQLVPYVAVHNANGNDVAEVLAPVEMPGEPQPPQPLVVSPPPLPHQLRPTIDDMIQRLQREQQRLTHEHDYTAQPPAGYLNREQLNHSPRARHASGQRTAGSRRAGSVEGVRQAENFMSRDRELNQIVPIWAKRVIVRPLKPSEAETAKKKFIESAEAEEIFFTKERKKRPQVEDSSVSLKLAIKEERFTRRKRRIIQQRQGVRQSGLRERYARRTENRHRNGITDYENPEDLSDDSDSDYTGDREWAELSESESTSEETEDSEWDTCLPTNSRINRRHNSSGSEGEEAESGERVERAQTSIGKRVTKKEAKKMKERLKRSQLEEKYNSFKELPEEFRPPDWFTDVNPKKTPYFPQIGDEVYYFRSGHQHYIDTVRQNKIYMINQMLKPHKPRGCQSDEVLAKIIDIKFDVKPPRLVTLKLVVLDEETNEITNSHFSFRYHDIENVVDFVILRQIYDLSLSRKWKVGDEFRSIIDDKWWFGTIECLKESQPFSHFQCFEVKWANGDNDFLSPWDLEPIDEEIAPENRTESAAITSDERLLFNYFREDEWPECGREEECQRILDGFVRIMESSHAEEFLAPVDLNHHPVYGMMISYPMDLSTIKSRLENRFYRRVDAIKSDSKFIEFNAEAFNEPGSDIVKKAKLITTLILRFIDDQHCYDPMPIYLDLIANYEQFEEKTATEGETADEREAHETRRSLRKKRRRSRSESDASDGPSASRKKQRHTSYQRPKSWKQNCLELLNYILEREDSSPFRSPVDPIQYPDYSQVIDTPMDLTTIKEQLISDLYDSPNEFCKDMRLVFTNSKSYNTNKKSRIYAMTVRLAVLFEERTRKIISDFRSNCKYESNLKRGIVSRRRKPLPMSPISNTRSPNKRPVKRSRRALSSSLSPTFDLSAPSTSGYSSRSKSSLNQGQSGSKNGLNSPKKKNRNNSINNNNKLNFRSLRSTDNVLKKNKVNAKNSRKIRRKVDKSASRSRKGRKRIIKDDTTEDDEEDINNDSHDDHEENVEDEDETEKEGNIDDDDDYVVDEEAVSEEIVNHFNSDTEVEESENGVHPNDSDATEIDDETDARPRASGLRRRKKSMRNSFSSEHNSYTLQTRRSDRTMGVLSRRARLKASEESESTQSSSVCHSNDSNHSNFSNESATATSSISQMISEESESYLSNESYKSSSRRTSKRRRSINTKWTADYESGEDLRRVSLGLRRKVNTSSRYGIDSSDSPIKDSIKTRSRNSGKKRVRYTEVGIDEEDFEYDNRSAPHLNEHSVSSRGRVRKFRAHARFTNTA